MKSVDISVSALGISNIRQMNHVQYCAFRCGHRAAALGPVIPSYTPYIIRTDYYK